MERVQQVRLRVRTLAVLTIISIVFALSTVGQGMAQQSLADLDRRLFSTPLTSEVIPRNATSRVRVAWRQGDVSRDAIVVLYLLSNGEVIAEWVKSSGDTLFSQMRALRSEYDQASFEELIPLLALDRTLVTNHKCVGLKESVASLQQLTLPVITDNEFFFLMGIPITLRSSML